MGTSTFCHDGLDRLFKHLKHIPFLLQPLDSAGHGFAHVRFGFQGVVEDNDGAVAGIVLYHIEDTVRSHVRTVIAGHHVPHDDLVLPAQGDNLRKRICPWGGRYKSL